MPWMPVAKPCGAGVNNRSKGIRSGVRSGHWTGSACPTADSVQNVLRLWHPVRPPVECANVSRLLGHAGQLAGGQSDGSRDGDSDGPRVELHGAIQPVCQETLFLSRSSQGLSSLAIRNTDL